jgi:multidrug resistance efflux pump
MHSELEGLGLTAFQTVRPPRAIRKLAKVLLLVFLTMGPAFVFLPWVQNVQAQGRVIALDPLNRALVIPAPVTGRLVRVDVQEGMYVQRGQVLAELSDQDPQYALRLEQQLQFMREKLDAARGMVQVYEQQLGFQEQARSQSVTAAQLAAAGAEQLVLIAQRDLDGHEADLLQKRADFARKSKLFEAGVVSELDFQKAEADFVSAVAKVEGGKAKIEQLRNDQQGKLTEIVRIGNEQQARIESTRSSREDARSKVAAAEKDLNDAAIKFDRQKTQIVTAPRDGYVLRVHAANSADLLSQGDPLLELIPDADDLAVELWVRGIDAPLIHPGRPVRIQFEGWPAVQFAGWPSVAVGTFGGRVLVVDAQGAPDGRFRVLVAPDPDDAPWPDRRYLRQGVRANGWLLLDTVRLGYEIWRQLNAFPPAMDSAPAGAGRSAAPAKKDRGSNGSKDQDGPDK